MPPVKLSSFFGVYWEGIQSNLIHKLKAHLTACSWPFDGKQKCCTHLITLKTAGEPYDGNRIRFVYKNFTDFLCFDEKKHFALFTKWHCGALVIYTNLWKMSHDVDIYIRLELLDVKFFCCCLGKYLSILM